MSDIKKEKIKLHDLVPTIRAVIESDGEFLLYPSGESMRPTIRPGLDAVLLRRADTLRTGDLVLYQRKDGAYVLHRIVKITESGCFTTRGDNQFFNEYNVHPTTVIAKVCAIQKGKKRISVTSLRFRLGSRFRLTLYPLRKLLFRAKNKLKRTIGAKKNG